MNIVKKVSVLASIGYLALVVAAPLTVFGAGPAAINLATAGNFAVLTKTGISTTGSTVVVGDIGVSPAPASYITGFALMLPAAGAFSTSAEVTGKVYASDYATPTPANLTTAVLDMQNAYTDGMSRAPGTTELGAGNIGGLTLAPGVYNWGTGVTIPSNITLSGGAQDVWIFQIAQGLTVSSGVQIILSGGAQASNIFWVVAGQTSIGTTAVFNGTILDQTAIVLNTGAQLNGRALAQTAVTLDSNAVTAPGVAAPSSASTPVQTTPASTPSSAGSTGSSQASSVQVTPTYTSTTNTTQTQTTAAANGTGSAYTSSTAQIRTVASNLYEKDSGTNVTILQQFLISQNIGSAARALGQVGATGYFGTLTRSALAEFQAHAGISPALGNFGPVSKIYISAHY